MRLDNFLQLKDTGFNMLCFPDYSRMIESIKPGDKFILYIGPGGLQIPGILEATSEVFIKNDLIWDDYFSKKINTKKYIILNNDTYVSMQEIKNGLLFIRPEVKKFGVYFMQGLRELSEDDYLYLLKKVNEIGCR